MAQVCTVHHAGYYRAARQAELLLRADLHNAKAGAQKTAPQVAHASAEHSAQPPLIPAVSKSAPATSVATPSGMTGASIQFKQKLALVVTGQTADKAAAGSGQTADQAADAAGQTANLGPACGLLQSSKQAVGSAPVGNSSKGGSAPSLHAEAATAAAGTTAAAAAAAAASLARMHTKAAKPAGRRSVISAEEAGVSATRVIAMAAETAHALEPVLSPAGMELSRELRPDSRQEAAHEAVPEGLQTLGTTHAQPACKALLTTAMSGPTYLVAPAAPTAVACSSRKQLGPSAAVGVANAADLACFPNDSTMHATATPCSRQQGTGPTLAPDNQLATASLQGQDSSAEAFMYLHLPK